MQLFRVAESFFLTGLGVLLLPDGEGPELYRWPLFTAVRVDLRTPSGQQETVIASVEEITRPGHPATRALLLTQARTEPVPPGTGVWWSGADVGWDELH